MQNTLAQPTLSAPQEALLPKPLTADYINSLTDAQFDAALEALLTSAQQEKAAAKAAKDAASLAARLQSALLPGKLAVSEPEGHQPVETTMENTKPHNPTVDELLLAAHANSRGIADVRQEPGYDSSRLEAKDSMLPQSLNVGDALSVSLGPETPGTASHAERLATERAHVAQATIAELEANRSWLKVEEQKAAHISALRAQYATASQATWAQHMADQGYDTHTTKPSKLGLGPMVKRLIGDTNDLPVFSFRAQKARLNAPKAYATGDLLQIEGAYGGQLIDRQYPTAGATHTFFCLPPDDTCKYSSWYLHQQPAHPQQAPTTIRYEIQPAGILKIEPGAKYSYLEGAELQQFVDMTALYTQQVAGNLYAPALHLQPGSSSQDFVLAA